MTGKSSEEVKLWPAPFRGAHAVDATVTIPGSKSVTNRALILAAQAKTPSTLRKPLISRDSELMSAGLQSLGIAITGSDESWLITPAALKGPAKICLLYTSPSPRD